MARRRQAGHDGPGLYLPSSDSLDAVAHMVVLGVIGSEAVVRPTAVPRTCEIDRPTPKILEMPAASVSWARRRVRIASTH
jgi:hypothetical protein